MENDNNLKEFGYRVRRRRRELDVTQEELAKRIGYKSKEMISKIESGLINLSMEKVALIAHALRCEVSDLVPIITYKSLDKYEEFLIDSYRSMDEEEKARLMIYIDAVKNFKKEKPE